MRRSKVLSYFLDAVNVAAVAVMISVLISMGIETLGNWESSIIALLSLLVIFKFPKISAMWIVLGGSVLGVLMTLFPF